MRKADTIWMNGEFVAWDDAKVHVLSHGLHYGTGVFEGIRAYETATGTAIFRHHDHLDRLRKSAQLYHLPLPFELEELRAATHELIRRNDLHACYIRPLVFRGYGEMGLFAESPVEVTIAVWEWGAYLGEESKQHGIRATPPHTASILDGISRRSVIEIARDLDFKVVERDIGRSELYLADEIFLTGTAAELVPVREIDDHPIATPGEITKVIAAKFDDALHGRAPEYAEWLDPVDQPSRVAS